MDAKVSELLRRVLAAEIHSYQGNLAIATHVSESGWLPEADDPEFAAHIAALRQHLASLGREENDRYLLRIGLTIPGMQRGIVPPLMVLEENRGGFSKRRKDEAAAQVARLREALALGHKLLPQLPEDTAPALKQLLEVGKHATSSSDTEQIERYGELDTTQAVELAHLAASFMSDDSKSIHEIGKRLLIYLTSFRESALADDVSLRLVKARVFWPASIYRDASERIAEELISIVDRCEYRNDLNHLLLAIAWTRSSAAEAAILRWTNDPPGWASKLFVRTGDYLHDAGWCLDDAGRRRDIISTRCFRVVAAGESHESKLTACAVTRAKCPSCSGKLVWLFDLSKLPAEVFQGEFVEAPRRVLCCLDCATYGTVFTNYRNRRTPVWHSGPERELPADPTTTSPRECRLIPGPSFAAAYPFTMNDSSSLGGTPAWLQDTQYPYCVECGRVMTFLAQHDNGAVGQEGVYYAFFCTPCGIAAVNYQQT